MTTALPARARRRRALAADRRARSSAASATSRSRACTSGASGAAARSPTRCSTGSSPTARRSRGALSVLGRRPPARRRAAAGGVPGDATTSRARALGALVHLTLDERYGDLSDPQIAQFAGISTEAFHKQFATKEACFLARARRVRRRSDGGGRGRASARAVDWPEAVHLRRCRRCSSTSPRTRRSAGSRSSTSSTSGPGMTGRMTRSIEDFTKLLDEARPGAAARPARRARSDHRRDLGNRLQLHGARPRRACCRAWSTSSPSSCSRRTSAPSRRSRRSKPRAQAAEPTTDRRGPAHLRSWDAMAEPPTITPRREGPRRAAAPRRAQGRRAHRAGQHAARASTRRCATAST